MKAIKILIPGLPVILFLILSQDLPGQHIAGEEKRGDLRIMFYNVENYFDTLDNSITRDEEYTPGSDKNWNGYKYYIKTNHIFKTIAAIGGMRPPEIIGFAEIENDSVLRKLIYSTGLSKYPYGIIHYDSPDQRGIDVGMIYRKDILNLVSSRRFSISFPDDPSKRTRDILYGKFLCNRSDTLHILVNHWPSRWGGKKRSEPARKHVAGVLRHKKDSILQQNNCANIIVMGDFNDNPEDESIREVLGAKPAKEGAHCSELVNMTAPDKTNAKGSYRYKAHWDTYDQIMVSGSLILGESSRLHCPDKMKIADLYFLLEEDTKYGGVKPKRTYKGPHYHGGFSDHLPVYIDVFFTGINED